MTGKRRAGGKGAPIDYTDREKDVISPEDAISPIRETGKRLNPLAVQEMERLVSCGVPIPTAATAVGAGYSAKAWAKKAREHRADGREAGWDAGQSPELYWLERMELAKAQFEANCTVAVYTAGVAGGTGDWKALSWMLERRATPRWHLTSKLEIAAKDGSKVEIETLSTEKLLAIARGMLPADAISVTQVEVPTGIEGELVEAELEKD